MFREPVTWLSIAVIFAAIGLISSTYSNYNQSQQIEQLKIRIEALEKKKCN